MNFCVNPKFILTMRVNLCILESAVIGNDFQRYAFPKPGASHCDASVTQPKEMEEIP